MHDVKTLDCSRIAQDLQIRKVQVENVAELLDQGNAIPFIAQYRKDQTSGLDEDTIRQIQMRMKVQQQLAERKKTILKSVETQGKLTEDLRDQILQAESVKRLEDLYFAFKPKKRTPAASARKRGLEPLAIAIWNRDPAIGSLDETVANMVDPENDLASAEDVINGAKKIIGSMISETANVRSAVRLGLWETGFVVSTKNEKAPPPKGVSYKEYFNFRDALSAIQPRHVLMINRGEREGHLKVHVEWDPERIYDYALEALAQSCMRQAELGQYPQPEFPGVTPTGGTPKPTSSTTSAPTPDNSADAGVSGDAQQPLEADTNTSDSAEAVQPDQPGPGEAVNTPAIPEIKTSDLPPQVLRLEFPNEGEQLHPSSEYRTPHADLIKTVLEETLRDYLVPALEKDVLDELLNEGNAHVVGAAARSIQALLLQKPFGKERLLAIDPDFRTGCKVAAIDENGDLLEYAVIYPHPEKKRGKKDKAGKGKGAKKKEEQTAGKNEPAETAPAANSAPAETPPITENTEAATAEPPTSPQDQNVESSPQTQQPQETTNPNTGTESGAAPVPPEVSPEATPSENTTDPANDPAVASENVEAANASEELPEATPSENTTEPPNDPEAPLEAAPESTTEPSNESVVDASDDANSGENAGEATPGNETPAESTEPPPTSTETDAGSPEPQRLANEISEPPTDSTPQPEGNTPANQTATPDQTPEQPAEALKPEPQPEEPDQREEAKKTIIELLNKHNIKVIALGNETASRETEAFLGEVVDGLPEVAYTIVNEAGASVYSASAIGREELPNCEKAARAAISIGRRLQDPLSELVKIDPVHLGTKLNQNDLGSIDLRETLESVVESCVNLVGVDVNTASISLLRHVAGLNPLSAREIVTHRSEHGPFQNRQQLQQLPSINGSRFTQAAGFLYVNGGDNPLDVTRIHPEHYEVTVKLLEQLESTPEVAINAELREQFHQRTTTADPTAIAQALDTPEPLLHDLVFALLTPSTDPRDEMPAAVLRKGARSVKDLEPGMELQGTVLNVVNFGTFVDIGLKESGLVHISQMANRFVKDPHDLVSVGDVVNVWVLKVDEEKGKVSLTMIDPAIEKAEQQRREQERAARQAEREQRAQQRRERRQDAPREGRGDRTGDRRGPQRDQVPGGAAQGRGRQDEKADRSQEGRKQQSRKPKKAAPAPKAKISKDQKEGASPLFNFAELQAYFESRQPQEDEKNTGKGKADKKHDGKKPKKKDKEQASEEETSETVTSVDQAVPAQETDTTAVTAPTETSDTQIGVTTTKSENGTVEVPTETSEETTPVPSQNVATEATKTPETNATDSTLAQTPQSEESTTFTQETPEEEDSDNQIPEQSEETSHLTTEQEQPSVPSTPEVPETQPTETTDESQPAAEETVTHTQTPATSETETSSSETAEAPGTEQVAGDAQQTPDTETVTDETLATGEQQSLEPVAQEVPSEPTATESSTPGVDADQPSEQPISTNETSKEPQTAEVQPTETQDSTLQEVTETPVHDMTEAGTAIPELAEQGSEAASTNVEPPETTTAVSDSVPDQETTNSTAVIETSSQETATEATLEEQSTPQVASETKSEEPTAEQPESHEGTIPDSTNIVDEPARDPTVSMTGTTSEQTTSEQAKADEEAITQTDQESTGNDAAPLSAEQTETVDTKSDEQSLTQDDSAQSETQESATASATDQRSENSVSVSPEPEVSATEPKEQTEPEAPETQEGSAIAASSQSEEQYEPEPPAQEQTETIGSTQDNTAIETTSEEHISATPTDQAQADSPELSTASETTHDQQEESQPTADTTSPPTTGDQTVEPTSEEAPDTTPEPTTSEPQSSDELAPEQPTANPEQATSEQSDSGEIASASNAGSEFQDEHQPTDPQQLSVTEAPTSLESHTASETPATTTTESTQEQLQEEVSVEDAASSSPGPQQPVGSDTATTDEVASASETTQSTETTPNDAEVTDEDQAKKDQEEKEKKEEGQAKGEDTASTTGNGNGVTTNKEDVHAGTQQSS